MTRLRGAEPFFRGGMTTFKIAKQSGDYRLNTPSHIKKAGAKVPLRSGLICREVATCCVYSTMW